MDIDDLQVVMGGLFNVSVVVEVLMMHLFHISM